MKIKGWLPYLRIRLHQLEDFTLFMLCTADPSLWRPQFFCEKNKVREAMITMLDSRSPGVKNQDTINTSIIILPADTGGSRSLSAPKSNCFRSNRSLIQMQLQTISEKTRSDQASLHNWLIY
jgi:hypothetical protein